MAVHRPPAKRPVILKEAVRARSGRAAGQRDPVGRTAKTVEPSAKAPPPNTITFTNEFGLEEVIALFDPTTGDPVAVNAIAPGVYQLFEETADGAHRRVHYVYAPEAASSAEPRGVFARVEERYRLDAAGRSIVTSTIEQTFTYVGTTIVQSGATIIEGPAAGLLPLRAPGSAAFTASSQTYVGITVPPGETGVTGGAELFVATVESVTLSASGKALGPTAPVDRGVWPFEGPSVAERPDAGSAPATSRAVATASALATTVSPAANTVSNATSNAPVSTASLDDWADEVTESEPIPVEWEPEAVFMTAATASVSWGGAPQAAGWTTTTTPAELPAGRTADLWEVGYQERWSTVARYLGLGTTPPRSSAAGDRPHGPGSPRPTVGAASTPRSNQRGVTGGSLRGEPVGEPVGTHTAPDVLVTVASSRPTVPPLGDPRATVRPAEREVAVLPAPEAEGEHREHQQDRHGGHSGRQPQSEEGEAPEPADSASTLH